MMQTHSYCISFVSATSLTVYLVKGIPLSFHSRFESVLSPITSRVVDIVDGVECLSITCWC